MTLEDMSLTRILSDGGILMIAPLIWTVIWIWLTISYWLGRLRSAPWVLLIVPLGFVILAMGISTLRWYWDALERSQSLLERQAFDRKTMAELAEQSLAHARSNLLIVSGAALSMLSTILSVAWCSWCRRH